VLGPLVAARTVSTTALLFTIQTLLLPLCVPCLAWRRVCLWAVARILSPPAALACMALPAGLGARLLYHDGGSEAAMACVVAVENNTVTKLVAWRKAANREREEGKGRRKA